MPEALIRCAADSCCCALPSSMVCGRIHRARARWQHGILHCRTVTEPENSAGPRRPLLKRGKGPALRITGSARQWHSSQGPAHLLPLPILQLPVWVLWDDHGQPFKDNSAQQLAAGSCRRLQRDARGRGRRLVMQAAGEAHRFKPKICQPLLTLALSAAACTS